MEILFRDDYYVYVKADGYLKYSRDIKYNIKHLDDVEVLCFYRFLEDGKLYPVYYEYNGRFVTKMYDSYRIETLSNDYVKDHTLTNLNLLEDGDTI